MRAFGVCMVYGAAEFGYMDGMRTLSEIADKLETMANFTERADVLVEYEGAIVDILDTMAWEKEIRPVRKVHVMQWFKDIDYELEPRLADLMAGMVRALYPAEPTEEPSFIE